MPNLNTKKIAIILPVCSLGGAKYFSLLLKAIIKLKNNYQIKIWCDMKDAYAKTLIVDALSPLGVEFEDFNPKEFIEKKKSNIKFLNKLINDIRKFKFSLKSIKTKVLNKYDLLFCPWPYFFMCPSIKIPIVCVPHDFNYTHHFGNNIYEKKYAKIIKEQHEVWFDKSTPIVSTNFMANELKNAFPDFKKDVFVAHLSKLNDFEKLPDEKVEQILSNIGIYSEYILCANNTTYHKNFNLLYGGYYYLKQKHPNIKLVMAGWGTEDFNGKSNSPYCIDVFEEEKDVIGLGLVSDEILNALLQKAKLVINPSLYEAGNGSGLDAWGFGAPVAMSDIEPFREQMEILGVKAQTFDPQNAKDIANAMIRIIDNPEWAQNDVEISKEAIKNYSWEKVAQKYINVFEKTMKEHNEK